MTATITDAVVWINHPKLMLERLCGLTVLERQLFLLSRAGIRRVWVASMKPREAEGLRAPEGLELHWVPRDGDGPVECKPPYLGYSGDHLLRREALEGILSQEYREHVSYQDEDRHGVVQLFPYRGERVIQFEKRALAAGSCVRVQSPLRDGRAEAWVLDGARKGQDGLMARLFDRRISLAVTRRLLDTPVRPNHMTVFSSLLGLAGAALFAWPDRAHAVAGALLVWLHSVLDGCDGELARLKFQESRFGGTLDFWGDNLVHVALFLSIGAGLWRGGLGAGALALGLVAAAASAAAAALAFRHTLRAKRAASAPLFDGLRLEAPPPDGAARALARIEGMLAQRDFIYVLVAAAAFDKLGLFLLAAAVGAPLFLAVLIYLTPADGAPASPKPELTGGQARTRGAT
ncbi:MAG: CDP-alcohol phosphatidyltransferase family protein [Elusimicrobia bacterium]|nr:CDP-alcohol phosphatidyltransferase family protein [Elusimicrobiota bacterium]